MTTPHQFRSSENGALSTCAKRRLTGGLEVLRDICREDSRVLDVGCGPGTITLDVAGLVPDGSVTGANAAQEAFERAKRLALYPQGV